MKQVIFLLFFIQSVYIAAQTNLTENNNATTHKTTIDSVFHPNPYRNKLLSDYFNPSQIDFSNIFLDLQTTKAKNIAFEVTNDVAGYSFDTSSLFCTGEFEQNGILGGNNKRIKIHISKATKLDNDSIVFLIEGKSNVDGNICDLKGEIKILSIYKYMADRVYPGQGVMLASYEFFEDKTQSHPGIFKGTFEATIKIDYKTESIKLDERLSRSFLYNNRSYVGTWNSYNDNTTQKCIWGDYRLPFTFDFDCGDRTILVCDKYINNGWTTFSDGSEYDCSEKPCKLKNQWWKN